LFKFFFTNYLLGMNRTKKNKFSNLARYTSLKYVISGKSLITPAPRIEKFQKWVEIKVNFSTNKEDTLEHFSNNFHSIKSFVQVDHLEKIMKTVSFFLFSTFGKLLVAGKFSRWAITQKIKHITVCF
jgi:hypothetical protein